MCHESRCEPAAQPAGGAHVTGIAYDASGAQIGTYDYDWYETDLSNVIPGTTWTDARTSFDDKARDVALSKLH